MASLRVSSELLIDVCVVSIDSSVDSNPSTKSLKLFCVSEFSELESRDSSKLRMMVWPSLPISADVAFGAERSGD